MKPKTYKRELAYAMFVWVVYLSIWGASGALATVIYPVMAYIALAMGLDWYGKQEPNSRSSSISPSRMQQPNIPYTQGAERSSQRASGAEQLPNSWHVDRSGRYESLNPSEGES